MNYGEAVTQIFDVFRDYEELENVRVRAQYQTAYNEIARAYRFDTMRRTETATWTSGTSLNPSGDLTRWRGRPEVITSAGERLDWARRTPLEITQRQNLASGSGDRTRFRGGIAYTITGEDNDIVVVSALVSETLTITHYSGPKVFASNSDNVDIPDDYVYMPIRLATVNVWQVLNGKDGSMRLPQFMVFAYDEYRRMKNELDIEMTMDEGVIRNIAEPPLVRGMHDMMDYQRSGYGRSGPYRPGEIV